MSDYWKLKAMEGLKSSDSDQMSKEEYDNAIDVLINNDTLKEGLRIKNRIPLK